MHTHIARKLDSLHICILEMPRKTSSLHVLFDNTHTFVSLVRFTRKDLTRQILFFFSPKGNKISEKEVEEDERKLKKNEVGVI